MTCAIHLSVDLVCHYVLYVHIVQMGQVEEGWREGGRKGGREGGRKGWRE